MSDANNKQNASFIQKAIKKVLDENEIWKSLDGDTFISSPVKKNGHEHVEHWPIYSRQGEGLLTILLSEAADTLVSGKSIEETQKKLSALATIKGAEHPVYLRVAHYKSEIYIDLCNERWEVVHVSPTGWEIISSQKCPVRFKRSSYTKALPCPETGGSLALLTKYLNVPSQTDFLMLISWMVGTFNPADEQAILILNGKPGSAKSTTAGMIRQLLDPSRATFRGPPKNEEAAILAAHNNWVLCFDNVRSMRPADCDVFCRLATTAGFGTRKLYSDRDEIIFDGVRPVVINGIGKIATEIDFLDRAIVIDHSDISPTQRQRKFVMKGRFEVDIAKILGALYDVLVVCLQNLGKIDPPYLPRMADFAYWVLCGEEAIGWKKSEFLAAHDTNYSRSMKSATEGSKIIEGIEKILDEKGRWEGNASDLLGELKNLYPGEEGLPSAANKLSEELTRLTLVLELKGITVQKSRSGECKTIHIQKMTNDDHDDTS